MAYFTMRQDSYLGLREVEQNLMMTEACSANNCTMMEVGEVISSMMKVCGATKRTLSKSVRYLIMSVVIGIFHDEVKVTT